MITGPATVLGQRPGARAPRRRPDRLEVRHRAAVLVSSPYRYDQRPSFHMPMCRSTFSPVRSPNAGSPGYADGRRGVAPDAHRRRSHRNEAATPAAASRPAPTAVERGGDDVLLDRRVGLRRQPVALGRLGEQEERAEPAGQLVLGRVVRAVQVGACDPALVQRRDPPRRDLAQLVVGAELDRVGRAGLRAGRLQAVLEPVVAERALGGAAVVVVAVDDAERARRDAVAAAVADVGLEHDGAELGADQRAGRARVEAAGVRAVLADVGHEHPVAEVVDRPLGDGPRGRCRACVRRLDEAHVPPGGGAERAGVVVGAAAPVTCRGRDGRSFHCLQATSHALQPMHVVVSVKNPMRSAPGRWIASSVIGAAGSRPDGRG